jgi:hypothetical protein
MDFKTVAQNAGVFPFVVGLLNKSRYVLLAVEFVLLLVMVAIVIYVLKKVGGAFYTVCSIVSSVLAKFLETTMSLCILITILYFVGYAPAVGLVTDAVSLLREDLTFTQTLNRAYHWVHDVVESILAQKLKT